MHVTPAKTHHPQVKNMVSSIEDLANVPPERIISHTEMVQKLRRFASAGIDVPSLEMNPFSPEFVERKYDERTSTEVEIYRIGRRPVQVEEGHEIDTHGNVVFIRPLEAQERSRAYQNILR
jgi:hypothetical protein